MPRGHYPRRNKRKANEEFGAFAQAAPETSEPTPAPEPKRNRARWKLNMALTTVIADFPDASYDEIGRAHV